MAETKQEQHRNTGTWPTRRAEQSHHTQSRPSFLQGTHIVLVLTGVIISDLNLINGLALASHKIMLW